MDDDARRIQRARDHYHEWLWSNPDLDFAALMAGFAASEVRRIDAVATRHEPDGFRLSLAKGLACAAICRDATDGRTTSVRTALFLAEAAHLTDYGRPLYGDRWVRTSAGPKPFALREATGRAIAALPPAGDMDVFSKSDLDHMARACATVSEGRAQSALDALRGWASTPLGHYAPLMANLASPDAKGDQMLGRALEDAPHAAY